MMSMIKHHSLAQRLQQLRCIIFDVEGILSTQSRVNQYPYTENMLFDDDRVAIKRLINEGFTVAVISSGRSSLMKKNLQDIGVKWVYMGASLKINAYEELLELSGFSDADCAHVGDGCADLPLFERVAIAVTVPDAPPEVRLKAHYCTQAQGAWGAVKEFVDLILFYQRGCH